VVTVVAQLKREDKRKKEEKEAEERRLEKERMMAAAAAAGGAGVVGQSSNCRGSGSGGDCCCCCHGSTDRLSNFGAALPHLYHHHHHFTTTNTTTANTTTTTVDDVAVCSQVAYEGAICCGCHPSHPFQRCLRSTKKKTKSCCVKFLLFFKEVFFALAAYLAGIVLAYSVDILQILANGLLIIKSYAASYNMDVNIVLPKLTLDITIAIPKWFHWLPYYFSQVLDWFDKIFSKINIGNIAFKSIDVTCSGAKAPGEVRGG